MGIPGTRRGNGQVTWWTGQGMAAGVERYFRRAYLTVLRTLPAKPVSLPPSLGLMWLVLFVPSQSRVFPLIMLIPWTRCRMAPPTSEIAPR